MTTPSPAWFSRALAEAPEVASIRAQGASLETLAWGEPGRPGLLFVHGFNANAWWWSHIAPAFSDRRRCAALSFSGMGGSEWRDAYSIAGFADEIEAALHGVGMAKTPPPVIVAHSFGGLVAQALAARAGQRLGGLILVDRAIHPPESEWRMSRVAAPKRRYPDAETAAARFSLRPRQESGLDFILDHVGRHSLVEVAAVHGGAEWTWSFDPDIRPKLTGDTGPHQGVPGCRLALIWGGRSALMADGAAERMQDRFPEATFEVIPEGEHHLMMDHPLQLIAAIARVLDLWKL